VWCWAFFGVEWLSAEPDFLSETFRVFKEKKPRFYGEYRTRRLVLAAWDRGIMVE
jgi:hypothetical protein